jgi:hypothetical protein
VKEYAATLAKGAFGMLASVTAAQEHIAWVLGAFIALATLVSIAIDIRRKLK